MVLRPLGHRLPACPDVRAAFNHSSFWLQHRGPPHSMQISVMQQKMPHTEPVNGPERTAPCVYGRKLKNQADITTLLPSSQMNRYTSVFAAFSAAARVNKIVCSGFTVTKVEHYTQIFKINIKHAHLLLENSPRSDTWFVLKCLSGTSISTTYYTIPSSSFKFSENTPFMIRILRVTIDEYQTTASATLTEK